jgi:hypothetical protein
MPKNIQVENNRLVLSKFIKGEIQNDETFAAAAATANHF